MHSFLRGTNLFLALFLGLFSFSLCACQRNRPPGYINLGRLQDLQAAEINLPEADIFLRRDERGFSAMSTISTDDLSQLTLRSTPDGERWVSSFSASEFAKDGAVVRGPATRDLPYFELVFDASEYGGVKDSLYVYVGKERPKEWRLDPSSLAR